MIRTAIFAAVFASAAFAAGCGDDSPMMMPDTDGGTTPPPTPPPTPVPPVPPTPVPPPPPMDGGMGEDPCYPTAEDFLGSRCRVCNCDNSGLTDFLASNPGIASSVESASHCQAGTMNRCAWASVSQPPDMPTDIPFACAEFVNNDLWLQDGSPQVSRGSADYPGGNGQFLADFNWAAIGVTYFCSGHECNSAWGISTMPEYSGEHVRQRFSEDCRSVTTEYYMASSSSPYTMQDLGWVDHCGDSLGDCP